MLGWYTKEAAIIFSPDNKTKKNDDEVRRKTGDFDLDWFGLGLYVNDRQTEMVGF